MIETKDLVTPKQGLVIRKTGKFNFKSLYKKAASWYPEREYDFTEKEHTEKDKPTGFEIIVKFNCERKVDDYVKFHIDCGFLVQKYRKGEGDLKINTIAYLELDYKKTWEITSFHKFLRFIYNNYIIKSRIQKVYEPKVYAELIEYINVLKGELNLMS